VRDVWDGAGVSLDHVEYAAYGAISSETAATLGGHYLYTGLGENRYADTVTADYRTEFVDIGRWAQPDPITFSAGDGNINRYVANNPTNLTDPSGLEEEYVDQSGYSDIGQMRHPRPRPKYVDMSGLVCDSVRKARIQPPLANYPNPDGAMGPRNFEAEARYRQARQDAYDNDWRRKLNEAFGPGGYAEDMLMLLGGAGGVAPLRELKGELPELREQLTEDINGPSRPLPMPARETAPERMPIEMSRKVHGAIAHDATAFRIALFWENDPATVESRFNQDLVDTAGNCVPRFRPDAQRIRRLADGHRVVDVIEVQSRSQSDEFMNDKVRDIRRALGRDAGDIRWIPPMPGATR